MAAVPENGGQFHQVPGARQPQRQASLKPFCFSQKCPGTHHIKTAAIFQLAKKQSLPHPHRCRWRPHSTNPWFPAGTPTIPPADGPEPRPYVRIQRQVACCLLPLPALPCPHRRKSLLGHDHRYRLRRNAQHRHARPGEQAKRSPMWSRRTAGSLDAHHQQTGMKLRDCFHNRVAGIAVLHNAAQRKASARLYAELLQCRCDGVQKMRRLRPARARARQSACDEKSPPANEQWKPQPAPLHCAPSKAESARLARVEIRPHSSLPPPPAPGTAQAAPARANMRPPQSPVRRHRAPWSQSR